MYCKKCLLPDTYLGIKLDENGICQYCNSYSHKEYLGPEVLKKVISDPLQRNNSSKYDCIVGFSGGRDSTYLLWYVVNVLKLRPLAVFSDDLFIPQIAIDNMYRTCQILGCDLKVIKHDNLKKCIKHNLTAWIKRPVAETLMFINVGERIGYETLVEEEAIKQGVKLIFGGRTPIQSEEQYKTNLMKIGNSGGRISWILGWIKQVLLNPYLAMSLTSLKVQYKEFMVKKTKARLLKRNNIVMIHPFYDYIEWKETVIEDILFNQLDWKIPKDAKGSGRFGCEVDTLRQYLYYRILGYNDQNIDYSGLIRNGQLTREQARLKLVSSQNISDDYIRSILIKAGVNADSFMRTLDKKYPRFTNPLDI